ncbi:hypothetical protein M569_13306, partial [Genlisea aurea]
STVSSPLRSSSALRSPEPIRIRPSPSSRLSSSSNNHRRSFPVPTDLRNGSSSQRSENGYLFSPPHSHSLSLSSVNPRYISPYVPSPPLNASSGRMGGGGASTYFQTYNNGGHLHYSDSHASFSPYASAQSLPGC